MRLFFALLLLATVPTTAQLVKSTRYFRILEATESSWAPGIVQKKGEPSGGMIYEVHLRIRKGGAINIQGLIVNGTLLPVEIIKDQQRNFSGTLKNRDIVTLVARTEKGTTSAPTDPGYIAFLNEGKNGQTSWVVFEDKKKTFCAAIPRFVKSGSKKLNE